MKHGDVYSTLNAIREIIKKERGKREDNTRQQEGTRFFRHQEQLQKQSQGFSPQEAGVTRWPRVSCARSQGSLGLSSKMPFKPRAGNECRSKIKTRHTGANEGT